MHSGGIFLISNRNIEIFDSIIEMVQLIPKQTAEEMQAWLFILACLCDSLINEDLGFQYFIVLDLLSDVIPMQRV
jgi:hypothetical protein